MPKPARMGTSKEEDHHRPHGEEPVVGVLRDEVVVRLGRELRAHEQRHHAGGEEEGERRDDVENSDALVVERRQPARHAAVAPRRGQRSRCGPPSALTFLSGRRRRRQTFIRPDVFDQRLHLELGPAASDRRHVGLRHPESRVRSPELRQRVGVDERAVQRHGRPRGRPRRARGTWRRRGPRSRGRG